MANGFLIFDTQINTDGVSEGLSSIKASFSGIASTAAKMSAAVTAAFTAASTAAVKVGMDFQASMSQVAATMGITADTQAFETLEAAAKEMGETTQFSASQAAEALNYLALAGYDAEKAVSALPTVLDVAAAGGMELAAASDMITDAMSALGLSTDEMTTFADRLAVTAQKSNTSVAQLGEAILTVGGTAKILSGGVVEMNTALGILADNGIKSAEGGTALRNVILSLSAPTDTAAAALDRLNVQAFDTAGNMRPLQDTFADLNAALSSLSDQERTAVLNEIFNKVDLKSVNALLGTSAERFEELSGYIADCEGAAADMAKTMNDNLKGDLVILGSALEGLGIAASEKFEQPMRTAVQKVTDSVGELTKSLSSGELSGSVDKVAAGFSRIAASAAEFASNEAIPAILNTFEWIIDNEHVLSGALTAVVSGFIAFKAIETVPVILTSVTKALARLDPVVLAVSAAFAGTMAIMEMYTKHQNEVREAAMQSAAVYQDEVDKIDDLTESYHNVVKEADDLVAAQDKENGRLNALKAALAEQVDENGKVVGSMELVKDIISEINEIYPEHIELINGQIKGYRELRASIDEFLEEAREEALLESKKQKWSEAITIYGDLTVKDEELQNTFVELSNKWREAQNRLDEFEKLSTKYTMAEKEAADAKGQTLETYFKTQAEAAYEAAAAAGEAYSKNRALMFETEKDIREYTEALENTSTNGFVGGGTNFLADFVSNQVSSASELYASGVQTITEAQKAATAALQEGWENLEHEYAVSSTMTEAELYDKKKALWNEYGDASLKDHWDYLEDITEYDKDFAEEQIKLAQKEADEKKKAAEEAANEEIAARKSEWENIERLNNLGIISDEDAAKARADFVKKYYSDADLTTGKGITDENYQYLKKVYDDNIDMTKQSLDEQEEIVSDGLSEIVKFYQDAYDKLDKKRESYRQKLMSVGGDLFSVDVTEDKNGKKTTTYTVNNIDEQLKKMREYNSAVKSLMKKGASDELISQLTSMNDEDSMQFAKYLSGMSASEFAKINELYNEKQKLADELSQDLYKDDAQMISDSYTSALADLANASREYGAQAAEEFAKGFNSAMDNLGISSLYNQMQASGANQTYQNYWTAKEAEQNIEVTIKQGKTYLVADNKIIGEISTNYNVEQKRKKGK